MALRFEKPDPTLLGELRAVTRRAGDLERALDQANLLPEDFPKADARALILTLEALPDGTAEGCREPLRFAEDRLAEIIRDHIQIDEAAGLGVDLPEDPDAPPALSRGGHIENSISLLISAITIARSEYGRQAGEAEEDEPPERAVGPNDDQAATLADLDAKASQIQAETRDLRNELDNPEHFNATDAVDELKRQGQDAETHIDLVRQTARQPAIRPGALTRLGNVIRKIPDAMEATGKGLKTGIDVLEPFANQWFNQIPTDIYTLVLKHLRLFADNVATAGRKLKCSGPSMLRSTPGNIFRDIDEAWCPEMVVIPAGEFMMGSPEIEVGRKPDESPQHRVALERPFALGRCTITFEQYDYFCSETGRELPNDDNWGRGSRPAINVSHMDALAYLAWLSEITERPYRLPSEAEWEYACRAGTLTRYSFGDYLNSTSANCAQSIGKTQIVGSYSSNDFGLCDMHGNVWEHCADAWHNDYRDSPLDGSAWLAGGDASKPIVRGGSWEDDPEDCRSAHRYLWHRASVSFRGYRSIYVGFRVARALR